MSQRVKGQARKDLFCQHGGLVRRHKNAVGEFYIQVGRRKQYVKHFFWRHEGRDF